MRFKRALNGIFQLPHDSRSLHVVFFAAAERRGALTERLCSFSAATQRLHLKDALQNAVNGTHAATNGPVVLAYVFVCAMTVQTENQALTPCDGALGGRQGCPAVPH